MNRIGPHLSRFSFILCICYIDCSLSCHLRLLFQLCKDFDMRNSELLKSVHMLPFTAKNRKSQKLRSISCGLTQTHPLNFKLKP
ncbi:hypothetical protein RIF29_17712 [Crotalaria pallida]|uniref:Uncharacterized protein n=1 Tax=Crotalaria pallida TaxID=3830 RepID=A0AAN9FHS5_CROPI